MKCHSSKSVIEYMNSCLNSTAVQFCYQVCWAHSQARVWGQVDCMPGSQDRVWSCKHSRRVG